MSKEYVVSICIEGRIERTVKADSPEEAAELVFQEADCGDLCDLNSVKKVVEHEGDVVYEA